MSWLRLYVSLIAFAVVAPCAASGQAAASDRVWTEIPSPRGPDRSHGEPFRTYRVALSALRERLAKAPPETAKLADKPWIALPLPDGRLERFAVVESPILGSGLRAEHPEMKTYAAVGVDDASLHARLDDSARGLRAIVFTAEGVALLDPLTAPDTVVSRWTRNDPDGSFDCQVFGSAGGSLVARPQSAGDVLKTLRFALLGTGQYTSTLGGVAAATAEMLTSMNRLDAIFERDAAVRLEVVGLMAFPDSTSDPYPSNTIIDLVTANTNVAESVFGASSFDLAQVVSQAGGPWPSGASFESNLCTEDKGGSVVIGPDPSANWFMLKIMAHEIGHMLGATHTQDADCNREPDTAYEPGSGSTIMSYGGKCPPYDVVTWADPYFHSANIEQMVALWSSSPSCGMTEATGNTVPTANAGPDYTIPRQTPFILTGGGFDADPWDTLTYCWEEMDKAPASHDTTIGPLFRSRPPSLSPSHAYPAFATVLSNASDPYEKLPAVDRTMRFRLTVRDNHVGTGGVAWDEATITVNGAPFVVTSPDGGESFDPDEDIPVTWNAGGGAVAPTVDILISTDAGQNWTMLAANVPNSGSQTVSYHPTQTSTTCRIKVQAVGNIFYDVSDSDFALAGVATDVPAEEPGDAFVLERPVPSPSPGDVSMDFALAREVRLDLAIFSVQGRRLRTLASGIWPAGRHRIVWDGKDDSGRRLGAGIYLVRGVGAGTILRRRAVLVR
jgi:reprolysin-like metallo-peptidase family M12B/flagellar hook capping protein FlgD